MHEDHDDRNEREEEEEEDNRDESEEEEEGSESNELEDNEVYRGWCEDAVRCNREATNQKYEKYLREGVDEVRARKKAHDKTLWEIKDDFFHNLETFLIQTAQLRDDDAFQEIMTDIDEKIEGGMELTEAVRKVLPKHKNQFATLFEHVPESEEESDGTEDTPSQIGGTF